MTKNDRWMLIFIGFVCIGWVVTHPSWRPIMKSIVGDAHAVAVTAPHDDTVAITQNANMIIVDKMAIKELLDWAKAKNTDLNVAIYEYDKKMGVWNRAETWCK